MSVRNEIKAQIVRAGFTMQEVVDLLHDEYGWSDSVSNLSAKLQRESIRYKEVVELAAVVHMDEKTPHMHLCFVPLTEDGRLSAKEIVGNKKKLIQWQDRFWEHMVKKYPDLEARRKRQRNRTRSYPAAAVQGGCPSEPDEGADTETDDRYQSS